MKKMLLQADASVQAVLLAPILIFGLMVFPLVLMIPLGGWQVGSALIKGVAWRSRFHLLYSGLAVAYCLALWAGFNRMVEVSFSSDTLQELWSNEGWGIFFIVIIPLVGALKYWKVSYDDCARYDKKLV